MKKTILMDHVKVQITLEKYLSHEQKGFTASLTTASFTIGPHQVEVATLLQIKCPNTGRGLRAKVREVNTGGFNIGINVTECKIHKTEKSVTTALDQTSWDTMFSCSCKVLLVFLSFHHPLDNRDKNISSTETISCDKSREDFSLGKCLFRK